MVLAVLGFLEGVGADDRADHRQEAAQDAVLVEARDGVERLFDLGRDPLGGVAVVAVGVQAGLEKLDQEPRDVGVCDHRALDVGVREAEPALAQVLGHRANDRDLPAGQGGGQDQAVEPVILELASPHADERVVQQVADALGVGGIGLQAEVVDPRGLAIGRRDLVGALVGHLGPEVLEGRQHIGQQHVIRAEQLEAHHSLGRLERPVEAGERLVGARELLDPGDVGHRRARHPVGLVAGRKGALVALEQLGPVLLAVVVEQRVAQVVGPGPDRVHEPGLDRGHVVFVCGLLAAADDVVHAREARLAELQRPVEGDAV